jgi:pimeloyl-ACP methyl ester carboxylesterase
MSPYRQRTIHVGDIQTHYLEAGAGPHLVLLHGGEYGASAEATWKFNLGPLAKDFHVVAPDMLGYGGTDKIYSFSDPAGFRIAHLKRFLETLDIHGARFIGSSAGGGTLLRAAVVEPPCFEMEKMVTICGNAGLFKTEAQALIESYTPSMENMAQIMGLLFHEKRWLSEDLVRERYENSLIPGSWETLAAARLRRPGRQGRAGAEEFVRKLSSVRIPCLILSCDHDPLNQKDWDVRLQAIISGSRTHRFKHSAHEPQIEEAEEFHRVVTEFLLHSTPGEK